MPYRNRRMILANGPVYTMDPRLPRVAALAVAGATIAGGVDVREGDTDAVGHERIDLEGRCVVPGFTDAHVHFQEWALARVQLDLRGCGSKAEALAARGRRGRHGWLIGARLGAGAMAGRAPERGRPRRGHRRSPGGAVVARRPHAVAELGRARDGRRPGTRPASCARARRSRSRCPTPSRSSSRAPCAQGWPRPTPAASSACTTSSAPAAAACGSGWTPTGACTCACT